MNDKGSSLPLATPQDFPIVGIGASAGGLDAFRQFLKAIPENSGMAYVLVQHLYPSHESILPEILSRYTNIPVLEISDDIHLAPDTIYVIPENKILTSIDGVLKLSPREKESKNAAIDIFFVSLAEVHLSLAIGIVLSGMGTDGTLGLKAIKKYGGITLAQDQASAAYSQMPLSAINSQAVDYVLRAEEMPAKLMELMLAKEQNTVNDPQKSEESDFRDIILFVRKNSGVDFTYYKQNTIRRRIARRMAITKMTGFKEYLNYLTNDPAAVITLFNDLLIPVSSFFRDAKVFDELRENILPAIVSGKDNSKSIRIWIAGCSTGEEAYSFAIALSEVIEKNAGSPQIKIFASDISEVSIARAKSGFYKSEQLLNVPDDLLEKYFTVKEGGYQIKRHIRDLCIFAVHNFLKDPPFARMDLISCRNVLIYMDNFIQKKALATFHYALSEKGFLLLCKSETTAQGPELFVPFLKTSKVYTRKPVSGTYIHQVLRENEEPKVLKNNKAQGDEVLKTDFIKLAQGVLLSDFTPASVIINQYMDIVHINGNISPFIELVQGKPTFNLLKIARPGLPFELRNAFRKAKDLHTTVVKEGILVKFNDKIIEVKITVRPLEDAVEPYFLVIFEKIVIQEKGNTKIIGLIQEQMSNDGVNLKRIKLLEKELLETHKAVNEIAEEQDASNEELQSANEELLSGSEEMQSLNEELETSKEELQSSNEELITINAELLEKQEQINISKNYTEAIVATLREPIVVLDNELRIKNINRAFAKKYGIFKEDAKGRLIYEICNNIFENSLIRSMLKKVLTENKQVDDYEISLNLEPGIQSVLLLNARQVTNEHSKEQLILLATEDITDRKLIERNLKMLSDGFEAKVKERTAELEDSNDELEKSVRGLHSANIRLQQFAYIASHDLQEPLRKIQTFISVLQQREVSQDGVKLLDKINTSSERMKTLINDLLAYSYLNNDKALFTATDLNTVLKNVLIDFEPLIEQKHVEIKYDILPVIKAIPLQMNQLFYNLIGNALKFLRTDNESRIDISCKSLSMVEVEDYPVLDKELSWCEITIKDNGIGFEQKYDKQIFTIFQRLHTNEIYKGTGIGLAISHKIIENHGGIIFAKSTLNKGAVFHAILSIDRLN